MAADQLARMLDGCSQCGSRQWVPVRRLTWRDRWRLWRDTGYPPWTVADIDPEW
jgi:hypothetical protein